MVIKKYYDVDCKIIDIEEVIRCYKISEFLDPNGTENDTSKKVDRVDNKIKTIIYTDGKITNIEEDEPIKIDEYYINGKKYNGLVTDLIKKRLHIEKANYVIKVVVAEETIEITSATRKGRGIFLVIRELEVYVKDKKDRESIVIIDETIKSISQDSKVYTSIWDALFNKKEDKKNIIEYKKNGDFIFCLNSRKKVR